MAEPAQERSSLLDRSLEDPPSFLRMIGIVAAGVALTILVFFALGYGFGRLFLF